MPGRAIGKELNLGYAGNLSRSSDAIIMNRVVKSSDTAGIEFGDPVVLNDDNTYSKMGEGDSAEAFAGIALREVKQATVFTSSMGVYMPGDPCDVAERGTVTVVCSVGTPKSGGPVYVRIAENASKPNGIVGGYEAEADAANTVLLPNVKWKTGRMDTNRVAEVTILTRNQP
ncbi:hypothetical protein [uncultured Brevibacillus sp.]|uniref:structural cement protein Gp24 n=1 Tax=uncultured Brevibacillus sp. TaxID=169970 RepID=UPI002596C32D|nr:hypothetical protein [uncultured Brevibacillus sp.]